MGHHNCGPIRVQLSRAESAYRDTVLSIKTNEELLRTEPPNKAAIKKRLSELYTLRDHQKMEVDELDNEVNECEAANDNNNDHKQKA